MHMETHRALWKRWIALWNGNVGDLSSIIHPNFVRHGPVPAGSAPIRGRAALRRWIEQPSELVHGFRFTVVVGPIVDGDMVAGRWLAEGVYQGGIPGSAVAAGTRVRFHGNDIWRAEGGLIREYWASDDLVDLLMQLGVV
jgi:predicted ester cyclase